MYDWFQGFLYLKYFFLESFQDSYRKRPCSHPAESANIPVPEAPIIHFLIYIAERRRSQYERH
ncbi:hypothetical protein B5F87_04770 [Eubacterium sp. An3]|nr:hypothetical protein B5F87_04770 [Eubacterium sp. An3]